MTIASARRDPVPRPVSMAGRIKPPVSASRNRLAAFVCRRAFWISPENEINSQNEKRQTCFLSLSKKRELSDISVRSDKNGDNNNSSIDELFAEVNGRVVVKILVRDVDEDISSAEAIF